MSDVIKKALEGLLDTVAELTGPTGCKIRDTGNFKVLEEHISSTQRVAQEKLSEKEKELLSLCRRWAKAYRHYAVIALPPVERAAYTAHPSSENVGELILETEKAIKNMDQPLCSYNEAGNQTIRDIIKWSAQECKDPDKTKEIQDLASRLKLLIS